MIAQMVAILARLFDARPLTVLWVTVWWPTLMMTALVVSGGRLP